MSAESKLVAVEPLVRAIVADMYAADKEVAVSAAIIDGIRTGFGLVDSWFAMQAAQRALNAYRAGAEVDGKGHIIIKGARAG